MLNADVKLTTHRISKHVGNRVPLLSTNSQFDIRSNYQGCTAVSQERLCIPWLGFLCIERLHCAMVAGLPCVV